MVTAHLLAVGYRVSCLHLPLYENAACVTLYIWAIPRISMTFRLSMIFRQPKRASNTRSAETGWREIA